MLASTFTYRAYMITYQNNSQVYIVIQNYTRDDSYTLECNSKTEWTNLPSESVAPSPKFPLAEGIKKSPAQPPKNFSTCLPAGNSSHIQCIHRQ